MKVIANSGSVQFQKKIALVIIGQLNKIHLPAFLRNMKAVLINNKTVKVKCSIITFATIIT